MKKILYLCLFLVIAGSAFSQDKNAVGSVGPVKFSGYMFGDLFYNADAIDSTQRDVNGFNFRRIYFTADYTINDKFSSRFRLESSIANGSNINVFVKDAYLQWANIFRGSNLVIGISPTPAFDVSESVWGYRSLEKTPLDYFGLVPSRDMGIDLKGKFDDKGILKYWVKLGNNSGSKPETDKYKRYYGSLQFTPSKNFTVIVDGDYNTLPPKAGLNNSAFTGDVFVNFNKGKIFSVAAEVFIKSQQNNYKPSGATSPETQNGLGFSFWAKSMFTDNIGIVGRFDMWDPNTNENAKNDKQNLIIGAIDFKVMPNFDIMPGIEIHTLEGKDHDDITPRITFYWIF
ncbi:MAG TPA: hypothetical protein P5545_01875 [Bacteroidota bacterium]|nr:hypothetical protein [Candidatus Kapabacteria bacterium]HRS01279.1 hypothetical protein [Bacteroidota bacterium]